MVLKFCCRCAICDRTELVGFLYDVKCIIFKYANGKLMNEHYTMAYTSYES